ncbi:hypothetical protein HNY73_010965 [Argiope bruennichi]|uniref:CCHC-type domain-containing protein n=1 Tax=Argiope bruennichi TaxID=94029 RepID=A0A8T0F7N6_ARGBR|nr:hypothetical protein HNY73_010965 [Argiope bruennichi]
MSILNNLKKCDLKIVAEELGETVSENAKILELKKLIENSDVFKTDQEFVRGVIKSIVEDRTAKAVTEQSKLEMERMKLARLEKEIELEKLKKQSLLNKLYETLDFRTKEYVGIREGKTWFPPTQLGRECDLFFSSRGKSLSEVSNSNVHSSETKASRFQKQAMESESFRRNKYQNVKPERICYVCGEKGESFHFARNCPKRFEKSTNESETENKFVISGIGTKPKNMLEYIDIFVDGKKVKFLKDSGSELIIVNKSFFPIKKTTGNIQIKTCFGNEVSAQTATFSFAFNEECKPVEIEAVISDQLVMEGIFPPKCLSLIQNNELVSTENKQADALSRNAVCMVTRSQSKITSKIATAQEADERMQLLKTLVEKELKDDYHIKEDVLYVQVDGRELIVVPDAMELEIIRGTGVKMRNKTDLRIKEILDQEFLQMIQEKETILLGDDTLRKKLVKEAGRASHSGPVHHRELERNAFADSPLVVKSAGFSNPLQWFQQCGESTCALLVA